jgi:outer membrane receptor protein involved in Fe transport
LIQQVRTFDNDLSDLSNFTSDFSVSGTFGPATLTLGYYKAWQEIDVEWYWQSYLMDVSDNARLMDAYVGATNVSEGGLFAHGAPDWGYCCNRDTDLRADIDAFYLNFNVDITDSINLDGTVRKDNGSAFGNYIFSSGAAVDVDGDGTITAPEQATGVIDHNGYTPYSWDWSYMSYSLGLNVALGDSMSVYGRVSQGGRANMDRVIDGGFIDGSTGQPYPNAVENELSQLEAGVKMEGDMFYVAGSVFKVDTDDVNSEPTSPDGSGASEPRQRGYEATGVELEGTLSMGIFELRGSATYTDAEIVDSNNPALVGNKPRRQADLVYSLIPSLIFGESSYGLSIVSTSDAYAQDNNDLKMPGYTYINAFADIAVAEGLSVLFSVNNLTDEIGITECEEGSLPGAINGSYYTRARSIAGTTSTVTLKYEF